MRDLVLGLTALVVVGVCTSCARSNCSGNWYNNRNVTVLPQEKFDENCQVYRFDISDENISE